MSCIVCGAYLSIITERIEIEYPGALLVVFIALASSIILPLRPCSLAVQQMAYGLIAQAPTSPDFHLCHPFYNEVQGIELPILMSDCLRAEAKISRSNEPESYYWWHLHDGHPDPEPRIYLPRAHRYGR